MVKEYKSKNLHISLTRDMRKALKQNDDSCFFSVMCELNEKGFYDVGSVTFRISGSDCFYLYGIKNDFIYLVDMSDFTRLENGKAVILKGWQPSEADRNFLKEFDF